MSLPLQPGPGLTLVVGRNGSGESSFAGGLEVLLAGHNPRWEGKKEPRLGVGPMTARRTWAADADVTMGQTELRDKAKTPRSLDALGWRRVPCHDG